MARILKRLLIDRRANVTTLTALTTPFALVLAAAAIDAGSLYTERRELQALADLSAIVAAGARGKPADAVLVALADNGVAKAVIGGGVSEADAIAATVRAGRYRASPDTDLLARFDPASPTANAVHVTLRRIGTRHFAGALIDPPLISVQATAYRPAEAAFSIGSRLASLDGGLVNRLLGGLIGGNVSLSLMDYRALVDADIDLLAFSDSLATRLSLTGVTYGDVLASKVSLGTVLNAMADIPGTDPAARLALRALASRAATSLKVPLGSLIDLGRVANLAVGSRPSGITAVAGVMDLVTTGAALANGEHQVRVDLGLTLPGLAGVTLDLAIGEPPQGSAVYRLGETGDMVRTAQLRLLLNTRVTGPGGLLGTLIQVPIYVEVAHAEARLAAISCPSASAGLQATVAARPGVATLRIADVGPANLADFKRSPPTTPARLVNAALVEIRGGAVASISNQVPKTVAFSAADIASRAVKTVATRDLSQSLVKSLLESLTLDVRVIGIDLGISGLARTTLLATLSGVTPALDQVLNTVLDTLGVRVGEVDVRMHGAACGRAVLVQ